MMELIPFILLFAITLTSGIIAHSVQQKSEVTIKLFLSFSGAFLLSTCVVHLLPEIFEQPDRNIAPYILVGFFLQIMIEYFSQGVEHGHVHRPHETGHFPFLIYIGLCFHAMTEGLPLADLTLNNLPVNPLYWGILLHKLPVAIILVTLFSAYGIGKRQLITALIVFSSLTPIGGLTGQVLSEALGKNVILYFLSISTGIFLHISTVILFETSHNHRFNLMKFLFIIAGGLLSIVLF